MSTSQVCEQCGKPLNVGSAVCPTCGHTQVSLPVHNIPIPQISVKVKASNPDERPHIEVKQGDDYSRSRRKSVRLSRVIDRAHNKYLETITDPDTGEVIRHVEEPLSEHQGRGAARKKGT